MNRKHCKLASCEKPFCQDSEQILLNCEANDMNFIVSSLYPKECTHTEADMTCVSCLLKIKEPFPITSLNFIFQKIIPITVPRLVKELSDSDIWYVTLIVKIAKITDKLVLILTIRYFTWYNKSQIRFLDLKPLAVKHQSEDDVVGAILDSIDQVNLREKIVSIEFDPNSVNFPDLRLKIAAQLGSDCYLFHLELNMTTIFVNLFEDIVKQLPFDVHTLVEQFRTNDILYNLGDREEIDTKYARLAVPPNIPDAGSTLHSIKILIQATISFDILKRSCKELIDSIPVLQHYTSDPTNRIFLLNIMQMSVWFKNAITAVQEEGTTFGNSFIALQKMRECIQVFHDDGILHKGMQSTKYFGLDKLNQEDMTKCFSLINDFYLGALEKCDLVVKNFIGPLGWVLLQSPPTSEEVLKSSDYFAQHGYPLRDLDSNKLENEIERIHRLIASQMLIRRKTWSVKHLCIRDRWMEIFRLDHKRTLEIIPRFVQLIFTAIPHGINRKVNTIYEDAEYFWKCEVERKEPLKANWLLVKTALMMRHNLKQANLNEVIEDIEELLTSSVDDDSDEAHEDTEQVASVVSPNANGQMNPKNKKKPKDKDLK